MTPSTFQQSDHLAFLGVDTGGTFTDFILLNRGQMSVHKVLSTPAAPELAILQGIEDLCLLGMIQRGKLVVIHGSTVATNAALQEKGAKTVYITNFGLKDVLTIGRQTRRELYNLTPPSQAGPVPEHLCLETGGRLAADGSIVAPLTAKHIQDLRTQLERLKPEAVAINLLFSFLDDQFEREIEEIIADDIFVCRSSNVLAEYGEYERGIATWLNAWLGPVVERYLISLTTALNPTPVSVMQSSGGTISVEQASSKAVNLLLSGPAGGLAAAQYMGKVIGEDQLMTFDMGGTSTDVSLLEGTANLTEEGWIGNYPVAIPMVDIHTIGAGGGSIAFLDEGGLLQVGPLSAGASPGPACYNLGGQQATVTDANAVLGRLQAEDFLGGRMALNINAAKDAIRPLATTLNLSLEETAAGIIAIANEHMTRALRVISVQRGHDPKDFRLCCFGGAGGLHLCDLAEVLDISLAMVPCNSGVLSALGMLVAPCERNLSMTINRVLNASNVDEITVRTNQLEAEGRLQLEREGIATQTIATERSIDLRYKGQSYALNVPWSNKTTATEAFHQKHLQRYGHKMDLDIEIITVRVKVSSYRYQLKLPSVDYQKSSERSVHLPGIGLCRHIRGRTSLAEGNVLDGPLLITEDTSTILVKAGWNCRRDQWGNLLLKRFAQTKNPAYAGFQ